MRLNRQGQRHGVTPTTRSGPPLHALERVRQLRVAWSERMRTDAGRKSQISARAPGRSTRPISARPAVGVGPGCIDNVLTTRSSDRSGERQRGHVADQKRRPARLAVAPTVAVGAGALDHGGIQVEPGQVQAVLAGQPDRQTAGPAPYLQHLRAVGAATATSVTMGPKSEPSSSRLMVS
jgi:hypothetical protein